MGRKYIDDLGINYESTPQGWNPDDKRKEQWGKEREEYGFDERETWSLYYTVDLFLYERLYDYNKYAPIKRNCHKFQYKNEEITFQECLDRMIEGLTIRLTILDYTWTEEQREKAEDVYNIYALCNRCLWW